MVEAIGTDELVHEAPAIVGCQTPSALEQATVSRSAQHDVLAPQALAPGS